MSPNTRFDESEVISPDATFDASVLKGKSVLITGGASGIGEECVRAFVRAGAHVTFGDLSIDRGESIAAELGPENASFQQCNVTEWKDQLNLFKLALSKSPSQTVDIALANAGINREDDIYVQKTQPDGDPIEPDLSVLNTNLIGVMYTAKLALYYFPKCPDGENRDRSLILTGSMASFLDQPRSPQYNASKWGLRGLMRSIRRTGPKENVRVNLIAPWFVDTRIIPQGLKPRIEAAGIEFVDIGDAANAVMHFASDKSINGRSFAIVPKSVHQRGYLDVELDDVGEDDLWGLARMANPPAQRG